MKRKIVITIILLFTLTGCFLNRGGDGGTTTGDPYINIEFEPYNQNIAKIITNFFIKDAYAGISSLNFCFKRIRFKTSDSDIGKDVELELGEVLVKPEGTSLGQVQIVSGIYRKVELDLEKDCEGTARPSVSFYTNSGGPYTTNDNITIKFEGVFDPSSEDLSMFIQNIVDSIKYYNGSGSIKVALEGVSGTF